MSSCPRCRPSFRFLRSVCLAIVGLALSACTSVHVDPPDWRDLALLPASDEPRHLFVFFDGTRNNPGSETNVHQLYTRVKKRQSQDPSVRAVYIEGVGNIGSTPLTGMIFGKGMKSRMLEAYEFLARNYEEDDHIYIFGFSRGAHQARALSGLLAYSGILKDFDEMEPREQRRALRRLFRLTRFEEDRDYLEANRPGPKWADWKPGDAPILAIKIAQNPKLGFQSLPTRVRFLGVWDTVPGSLLKDFDACRERPDRKTGDRYKSASYPPIETIVHALSMDEKRSQFWPILLCAPINDTHTKIQERWFPGAHSDVGGGYDRPDALIGGLPPLSNTAFNWMTEQLKNATGLDLTVPHLSEGPLGVAHWSVKNFPGNLLSRCCDRGKDCDKRAPIVVGEPHESLAERKDRQRAPLLVKDRLVADHPYPPQCGTSRLPKPEKSPQR
jgi:Uncharacterized alpha/beta hydrolase domain (DUF2235)